VQAANQLSTMGPLTQLYLVSIPSDGGKLSATTCFGHHAGHHHVVHSKADKLIGYVNSTSLMSRTRTI